MLQASVQPLNYSLRERKPSRSDPLFIYNNANNNNTDEGDEEAFSYSLAVPKLANNLMSDDEDLSVDGKNKSRRELPPGAVAALKAWLLSPEHFSHPYPTPQDQAMLMQKTGIDKKQLKNWFTNARRRIWKPMLKKQIESGQLTANPGLMMTGGAPMVSSSAMDNPHSVQAVRAHYQQASKHQEASQELQQVSRVFFEWQQYLFPSSLITSIHCMFRRSRSTRTAILSTLPSKCRSTIHPPNRSSMV